MTTDCNETVHAATIEATRSKLNNKQTANDKQRRRIGRNEAKIYFIGKYTTVANFISNVGSNARI